MKRAHRDDSQSSMQVKGIQKDGLDYLKEMKLNIVCDEDGSHLAVLYCMFCKTNLCKICADRIHSLKSLSGHQVVRLSEKPEPPIKCSFHPYKKAKLICKEKSCKGVLDPMCTICLQYDSHKGHKYAKLDDEYDNIRSKVGNCSKKIGEKLANLEEYVKCISTYSINDASFMQSQRDKIEMFYSKAKTLALKKLDDFAKDRFKQQEILKNRYNDKKLQFDNMSLEVRKIEKMQKLEMIGNGKAVEKLMRQAEGKIDEPSAEIVPSESYIVTCPSVESMKIEIDLPERIRLQDQSKILAVWFINFGYSFEEQSENLLEVEDRDLGRLCKYSDGRNILDLKQEPDDNTIDLSRYKYYFTMFFDYDSEKEDENTLKKAIQNKLWIRIIVVIEVSDSDEDEKNFEARVRQIAETDIRVEVIKCEDNQQTIDILT